MNTEEISMQMIANSGEARSLAFEALHMAREGNYTQARELLENAKELSLGAHKAQTDLLFMTAQGEQVEINVFLVHAQDHFMTSLLAIDLIEEIISIMEKK